MRSKFFVQACSQIMLASLILPATAFAQRHGLPSTQDAPLMRILDKFTAADVPTTGAAELSVPFRPPVATTMSLESLPGRGLAQHPMLCIGEGNNKMYVIAEGKVIWTYSTGRGGEFDDAWMLSNGNILYSRMSYVEMITPRKEVVWRYNCEPGTEIHVAQPVGLDKVMVVSNDLPPKMMIFDIPTSKVEMTHDLPAPSATDRKTVHAQYRRARVTAEGTYLLACLNNHKVVEFDKDWKEIWSFDVPTPWAAVRLHNGNTLITSERPRKQIEVNKQGEVVWEFGLQDLPPNIVLTGTQTATRLANGNTIICSTGQRGKGAQLIEVTPEKKVVWVLYDWENVGPATAVQVLDDPGIPENPGDLQR